MDSKSVTSTTSKLGQSGLTCSLSSVLISCFIYYRASKQLTKHKQSQQIITTHLHMGDVRYPFSTHLSIFSSDLCHFRWGTTPFITFRPKIFTATKRRRMQSTF